jgi:hypothetical protein
VNEIYYVYVLQSERDRNFYPIVAKKMDENPFELGTGAGKKGFGW